MEYSEAIQKIISELEKNNYGRGAVNFRLRDAIFSRQRYWGEPIPIYFKSGVAFPLNEKNLPLILPEVENYLPTSDGKPPLGNASCWAWDEVNERVVDVEKIDNKTIFPIELNTMPGWVKVPGILIAIWIQIIKKILLVKRQLIIGKKLIFTWVEVSMPLAIFYTLAFGKRHYLIWGT